MGSSKEDGGWYGSTTLVMATLEFKRLRDWLKEINYEALDSLYERGTETLIVIELQASKELRKSLLSTNQIARWVAAALLGSEKIYVQSVELSLYKL